MARRKTASDERYNARRRAKRLIARIERDAAKQSREARRANASYVDSLKNIIAQSYQKIGGVTQPVSDLDSVTAALERATAPVRRAEKKGSMGRANMMFARRMNLAPEGARGAVSRENVSIFYAATKHYWQGRDPERRNESILRGLGVSSLEEAYTSVLKQNRQAMREARRAARMDAAGMKPVMRGLTTENLDFYAEVGFDSERGGSPDYLAYVVMV